MPCEAGSNVGLSGYLPPVQASALRCYANPGGLALERSRHRGTCEFRRVVLSGQMRRDEVLKTAAVDPGEYARSGPVVEMPETSGDTPLERRRVRPIHEQLEVVITFEHESVDARQ